jgi:hypothetical protein
VRNHRALGIVLAIVLTAGVVGLAVLPRLSGDGEGGGAPPLTEVRALVSSEKQPLLTDPETAEVLGRAGYRLVVDVAGSREIATSRDLSGYDLAFPANAPQADRIKADLGVTRSYVPFQSPLAIATFRPIADLLATGGLTRRQGDATLLDVGAYLDLVANQTRWSQLPGNAVYQTDKSILISSTDVRTSNSAALYLSVASYVANGNQVVADPATADAAADLAAPLFLRQGYLDSSSVEPFDDYLTIGVGKTPMVMIYEAQFVAREIAEDPAITDQMTLLYPSPTIFAKHTAVPLTEAGDAVARLLTDDPDLQRVAARYGFRTGASAGVRVGSAAVDLVDVIEPPSLTFLERMIGRIEDQYQEGSG